MLTDSCIFLARLDGTNKTFKKKTTLEEYMQFDDWELQPSSGKQKKVSGIL